MKEMTERSDAPMIPFRYADHPDGFPKGGYFHEYGYTRRERRFVEAIRRRQIRRKVRPRFKEVVREAHQLRVQQGIEAMKARADGES